MKKLLLASFIILGLFSPSLAFAQAATPTPEPLCDIPGKGNIGVNTALGCLPAGDPKALITLVLGWATGLGGTIAFLLAIYSGFQMVTAGGDPKRFKSAQETLTSAIGGLILIMLSLLLLNFIGFDILQLPGFKV